MAADQGPSRAHLWLAKSVGTWDVAGHYYVTPEGDPVEARGTEQVEMFGPYWRRGSLELDVFDSPVKGCTCIGFDPLKQIFIGTWFDSSNPFLYAYRGRFDENENLLIMSGRNTDPATGKPALYRSIERVEPDQRSFALFVKVPGRPETQILTYVYTRRA